MAADGPALLAAAVRAACLAKAPRRTVQAVASAVAGVLARPPPAEATPAPVRPVQANFGRHAADGATSDASPEELLAALRAARTAQRKRKKERRRAKKAPEPPTPAKEEPVSKPEALPLVALPPEALPPPETPLALPASEITPSQHRDALLMLGIAVRSQASDDGDSVVSMPTARSMTDAAPLKRPCPLTDSTTMPPPGRQRQRTKGGSGGAASSRDAAKRQ